MEFLTTRELTLTEDARATGELFIHDRSPIKIEPTAFPLFALRLEQAYKDLAKNGSAELSPAFFEWMRANMAESPESKHLSRMHSAFNNVFPIPGLPPKVAPEFSPWIEVQTQDPDKYIVVQPVIFMPQEETKVFVERKVAVREYTPPRVDPFLVATLSRDSLNANLGRDERSKMREMIRAFWKSIDSKNETHQKISANLKILERRQAAILTSHVMMLAALHASEVATRMKNYVFSQSDSPLSLLDRAKIQFSWVHKASQEWMKVIKATAEVGHVELPQNT